MEYEGEMEAGKRKMNVSDSTRRYVLVDWL